MPLLFVLLGLFASLTLIGQRRSGRVDAGADIEPVPQGTALDSLLSSFSPGLASGFDIVSSRVLEAPANDVAPQADTPAADAPVPSAADPVASSLGGGASSPSSVLSPLVSMGRRGFSVLRDPDRSIR